VADRRHGDRDRGLQTFDYDPFVDIAPDDSGCRRRSSSKTPLHDSVLRYFEGRNEDGV
jgi:hypothetical protein